SWCPRTMPDPRAAPLGNAKQASAADTFAQLFIAALPLSSAPPPNAQAQTKDEKRRAQADAQKKYDALHHFIVTLSAPASLDDGVAWYRTLWLKSPPADPRSR